MRDLLLGLTPKDYDVATSATPDQITTLFPKTFAVGAHFGVILVCTPQPDAPDISTEVATFRHDGAYSDGRRPDAGPSGSQTTILAADGYSPRGLSALHRRERQRPWWPGSTRESPSC